MASNRTYPRAVWVIQPSFKIKQVEVVRQYSCWGNEDYGDLTVSNKRYSPSEMFGSKEEAMAAAREKLQAQQNDLDKRQEALTKRWKMLEQQSSGAA